jgi:hypothetical protein
MIKWGYSLELLADLKKEFPEATIEEIMAKADVCIAAEQAAAPASEPMATDLL